VNSESRMLRGAVATMFALGGAVLVGSMLLLWLAGLDAPTAIGFGLIGTALVLAAAFFDRLTGLKIGATSLEVTIRELGAPRAAQLLGRADISGMVSAYAFVRSELGTSSGTGPLKVLLQDRIVALASALAMQEKFRAAEVRKIFADGSPIVRMIALGLMRGDQSLADGATVVDAVTSSRTGNEQYQGLLLAEQTWRKLSAGERDAVLHAVDEDPRIAADSDRAIVAARLRGLGASGV